VKVLIVHNAYQSHQVGGEDIVVRREIRGLQNALGLENVFEYIVSNDDIQPLKLALDIWGSKCHAKKIADMVQKHQIDIVHVHNFFPLLTPSIFAAAKTSGAKVIHTLHNFRWWCSNGILYRKEVGTCEQCVGKRFGWSGVVHGCYRDSKVQSLVANMAFSWYRLKEYEKNIDAYFVLTDFQREKLATLLPAEKLFLKPNPIDERQVDSQPKKDYLFVGRLESAKGIELLLSVWQQLPRHFHLNIIGSGDNGALLSYQQSNIRFLGTLPSDEAMSHMMHAKYLIHPSLTYETFGLTLVEALSVGTPVIGFARGTRPEFIQHGENGFLCEPEDLKQTLLEADKNSLYEQMSICAQNSVKKYYLSRVMETQISHYEKILQTAPNLTRVPAAIVGKTDA